MTVVSRAPVEAVTGLLDAEVATRVLRGAGLDITAARPDYLRHKPGETSVVSYRFTTTGGDDALGYVRWCARPERADDLLDKALTLRPCRSAVGVSVVRVDDHTVFYGFPNDPRLRRLRWYTTGRKLVRALAPLAPPDEPLSKSRSDATVLKYKPERRVVVRADLTTRSGGTQPVLVRYTTARTAHRIAATAAALLDHGVATPAPLAQLDDGRVGVDEFVAGTELRTWLLDHPTVADELAATLVQLHRTTPQVGLPARGVRDDLENAIDGLGALSAGGRGLSRRADAVARRMASTCPEPVAPALVHGDLHDKNILVADGEVRLIDLERAAVGDPATDLGRLRAHAVSLEIRQPGWSARALPHADAVIDRYRSAGVGTPIGDRRLAWHCAVALVDQALLVTRHIEDGWQASAAALLDAALDELRSSPARTRGAPRP